MSEEQIRIQDYLTQNGSGYDNRRTSTDIRENCGLASGGVTNEHVRDLIRDMILNHGSCIGSIMWHDGYWIIQTEEELEMVTRSLKQRASGVLWRAEALRANFLIQNNG
jgi:hypothetical protein